MPVALDTEGARRANDFTAGIVAERPDRFGLLASIPLGAPEAAAAEVARALDELNADGFVLLSKLRRALPRRPQVRRGLRRAQPPQRHRVPTPGISGRIPGYRLRAPRAGGRVPLRHRATVTDAVYARLFQRHPGFRLILAHAGGALPALASRLATVGVASWVPNPHKLTSADVTEQLASLYYDTAIAGTANSLLPVCFGNHHPRHVLIGTDFPPAGLDVIDATWQPRKHHRHDRRATGRGDRQHPEAVPAPAHPTQRRMTASSPIRKQPCCKALEKIPERRSSSSSTGVTRTPSARARPRLTPGKQAT